MHPSAAKVASCAGVSLRTVFRHFEEMDSLFREMTHTIEERILPILEESRPPLQWPESLYQLISVRAVIYEEVMLLKLASDIRRFKSAFLMDDYHRYLLKERQTLEDVLTETVLADTVLVTSLDVALCLQTWRKLRLDLQFTADQAQAVMRFNADKLIAAY